MLPVQFTTTTCATTPPCGATTALYYCRHCHRSSRTPLRTVTTGACLRCTIFDTQHFGFHHHTAFLCGKKIGSQLCSSKHISENMLEMVSNLIWWFALMGLQVVSVTQVNEAGKFFASALRRGVGYTAAHGLYGVDSVGWLVWRGLLN